MAINGWFAKSFLEKVPASSPVHFVQSNFVQKCVEQVAFGSGDVWNMKSDIQCRFLKCFKWAFLILVLTVSPAKVSAQFVCATNAEDVSIVRYTGSGGVVTIPDFIGGLPVASIGVWAFQYCTNVTSVVLGANVVSIEAQAFQACSGITNITLGCGLTNIGTYAFVGCLGLTSLTIPDGVVNIGDAAFQSCTGLTNVIVGSSVASVGGQAFSSCYALARIYFKGNAPSTNSYVFHMGTNTVYYLPGTTGWSSVFAGRPAVLWNPQARTDDAVFGVQTNRFGFTITGTPNIPIVVDVCADLAGAAWQPVLAGSLTNGAVYFSDSGWTNYPARFYRIRSP